MNPASLASAAPSLQLADLDPILPTSPGLGTEILIQTAAGLVLFAIMLIVVRIVLKRKKRKRKRKRKRRHHHRRHHRAPEPDTVPESDPAEVTGSLDDSPETAETPSAEASSGEAEDSGEPHQHEHRRRRRMRRTHRPRFPTLAETGGLPPRRDPSSSDAPDSTPPSPSR